MSWEEEAAEIQKRREWALEQGGSEAIAKQHAKGRLTIRERIDRLVDDGSFEEVGRGAGEPVRDDKGALIGFSPANYVLGFAKLDG